MRKKSNGWKDMPSPSPCANGRKPAKPGQPSDEPEDIVLAEATWPREMGSDTTYTFRMIRKAKDGS